MATQAPPAAYRSTKASTDFLPATRTCPEKSLNETLATRDAALPCRVLNAGGGRHVFHSTIDASSLRGMALPTDAVERRRTFADRHRSHGRHRPLQRAKAEGRYRGERREHPQLGARRRVRSGGSLSAGCGQWASAKAGARSS